MSAGGRWERPAPQEETRGQVEGEGEERIARRRNPRRPQRVLGAGRARRAPGLAGLCRRRAGQAQR